MMGWNYSTGFRITRKYAYLIYYTIDADAEEIIILNIKHPAQKRVHSDI